MKYGMSSVTGVMVFMAHWVSAGVLDDFTDPARVSKYIGYDENPAAGVSLEWRAEAGALKTFNGRALGARTGGFFWVGGEVLRPGDTVRVGFTLENYVRGMGLRFARAPFGRALTAEAPHTGDVSAKELDESWFVLIYKAGENSPFRLNSGSGRGSVPDDARGIELAQGAQPSMKDPLVLEVRRETGDRQNRLRWSFSGDYLQGNTGVLVYPGLEADEPLYFALNQLFNSKQMRFSMLEYEAADAE